MHYLYLFFIVCLASCKSLEPTTQYHATQHYTTLHNAVDTMFIRDSIFIREVQKDDTIYLTRVEWRDRWRTRIVHDTVLKTDSIVQVIEHPPERFIPPFYKHCTTILFIILAAGIVYFIIRWRLRR